MLAEAPAHGFAVAKQLAPNSELGRILTVRRPLVYRSIGRLEAAGLAESVGVEPGEAGPDRTLYRATRRGRSELRAWLAQPVRHVRDLRIAFLLKVALLSRADRPVDALVESQRAELAGTFDALGNAEPVDAVDLWRQHTAAAAAAFLSDLVRHAPDGP